MNSLGKQFFGLKSKQKEVQKLTTFEGSSRASKRSSVRRFKLNQVGSIK